MIKIYLKKLTAIFIVISFSVVQIFPMCPAKAHAQSVLDLPAVGTMVSPSQAYVPPMLKGLIVHPDEPFRFDFILDSGHSIAQGEKLKAESEKLIRYFLASLTIPEDELWVNLSPYEKDRIIPDAFSQTEMGRDLLAQDYLLKQLTASLMYPEDDLGADFWDRVYEKAYEKYGTTEIPIDTFNKVWIIPERALVYENGDRAFVVESHLKVMLEQDYVAMDFQQKSTATSRASARDEAMRHNSVGAQNSVPLQDDLSISSQIIREIIIPEIEKEVNQGQNFAKLRQIFSSFILASWYKKNLKESILNQKYSDQKKMAGLEIEDKQVKNKIYQQYLEAFKKGVYNFIREDYNPDTQEIIPRKYFSGGIKANSKIMKTMTSNPATITPVGNTLRINGTFSVFEKASSMVADTEKDEAKAASPATVAPFDDVLSRDVFVKRHRMIVEEGPGYTEYTEAMAVLKEASRDGFIRDFYGSGVSGFATVRSPFFIKSCEKMLVDDLFDSGREEKNGKIIAALALFRLWEGLPLGDPLAALNGDEEKGGVFSLLNYSRGSVQGPDKRKTFLKFLGDIAEKVSGEEQKLTEQLIEHYLSAFFEKSGDLLVNFITYIFDEVLTVQEKTGDAPLVVFPFTGAEPLFETAELIQKSDPKYRNIRLQQLYFTKEMQKNYAETKNLDYFKMHNIFSSKNIFIVDTGFWATISRYLRGDIIHNEELKEDLKDVIDINNPPQISSWLLYLSGVGHRQPPGINLQGYNFFYPSERSPEIAKFVHFIDEGMEHSHQSPSQYSSDYQPKLTETSRPILHKIGKTVLHRFIKGFLAEKKDAAPSVLEKASSMVIGNQSPPEQSKIILNEADIRDLAKAAIKLVEEIHDQEIEIVLMSGGSAPLPEALFKAAWETRYGSLDGMPQIYLLGVHIDRFLQTNGIKWVLTKMEEVFGGETVGEIKRSRIAYVDDVTQSGWKRSAFKKSFDRMEFRHPVLYAVFISTSHSYHKGKNEGKNFTGKVDDELSNKLLYLAKREISAKNPILSNDSVTIAERHSDVNLSFSESASHTVERILRAIKIIRADKSKEELNRQSESAALPVPEKANSMVAGMEKEERSKVSYAIQESANKATSPLKIGDDLKRTEKDLAAEQFSKRAGYGELKKTSEEYYKADDINPVPVSASSKISQEKSENAQLNIKNKKTESYPSSIPKPVTVVANELEAGQMTASEILLEIERIIDYFGSNMSTDQIYFLQLRYLQALGVLTKDKKLFNLTAGADLFPRRFVREMRTVDYNLNKEEVQNYFRSLRKFINISTYEELLPKPNRMVDFVHDSVDMLTDSFVEKWTGEMTSKDIVFMKYTIEAMHQWLRGSMSDEKVGDRIKGWIDRFVKALPPDITLIIFTRSDVEQLFPNGFVAYLLETYPNLFENQIKHLSDEDRKRWHKINSNKHFVNYRQRKQTVLKYNPPSLGFFGGGPLTILKKKKNTGGIDLHPDHLDLQTQGSGVNVLLPDASMTEDIEINGLVPFIFSITPVTNLPFLLGLADGEGNSPHSGTVPFTADADSQTIPFEIGFIDKYRNKYARGYEYEDVEV